ncbi:hypothetical protein NE237_025365 [Protea cynaroides]|uniref:Cation/H+ exchanger domain-containing protein n=1 Tax=Protea cynaroides TaxID=273540 RepID=A0A9Q0H6X7_9MAGN|nr:hypothetical protein NE237_025365 [Protea cynaroides]
MDSGMMEPVEFWDFAHYVGHTAEWTCLSNRTSSGGIFKGNSPLGYYLPILVLQISLASLTINVTSIILKPLGQPLMVAQVLGGILLGPSALAYNKTIARALFPLQSFIMLDVIAVLGIMFYFFLIGVCMDPWIVMKIGKKAYVIGITACIFSTIIPWFSFYYVYDSLTDEEFKASVPYLMRTKTIFTFPIIARFLYELNILNSEFGGVALSSSIVGGLLSIFYQLWRSNHNVIGVEGVLQATTFMLVILFIVRPVALWMIKRNKERETVSICSIILAVLVAGLVGHCIGFHIILGPFILGVAIPPGPPLGAALVKRLDVIVSWILMPIFFLKIGLAVNIYVLQWINILNVGFVILVGSFAKFLGAFLAALKCELSWLDALSVGLVLNVKGALELTIVEANRRKLFALEKRTSLIILPFHEKRASTHSTSESSLLGSRTMNLRVLDNAPCSVAILVERGLWNNSMCALANWSPFRVVVLFLGGPDDREALAFGARITGHPKVNLLVIRIVPEHYATFETGEKTKLDNDIINDFRNNKVDNDRVRYIEQKVMDGSGTLRVIQTLQNDFQLIMVGRHHDKSSPTTLGLDEWNEFTELGTIGDIFASADFRSDAMILVVQQHVKVTK